MFCTTPQRRFTEWNKDFEILTGWSHDELKNIDSAAKVLWPINPSECRVCKIVGKFDMKEKRAGYGLAEIINRQNEHIPVFVYVIPVYKNGELDRKKIREIVFYNPSLLKKLEDIVHPKTLLEIRNLISSPVASIQLFLIPLLFEKGIENWFDFVITVYCSKDVIIKRATIRDNVNPKEVEAILKNQLPYEKKIARSHFVIDNSYEISSTKKQIEEILRKLSLL